MSSFISSFKAILIAIVIIATIETACWLFASPSSFNNTSLFQLAYLKPENASKVALLTKLEIAHEMQSQFLQVGDSSGLHGLDPKVIEAKLPQVTYTNANIAADFGYLGHYNIAKTILNKKNHVQYLVLYVTPMAWPAYVHDEKRTLEKNVYSAFLSPWHYLSPPSLTFRKNITNLIYYGSTKDNNPASGFELASSKQNVLASKGFIPRDKFTTKTEILPQGACAFSEWFQPSKEGKKPIDFFYSSLEKMALMARQNNLHFIMIFNPVTCEEKQEPGTLLIERELARLKQNYPEVIIPFPFITTWPKDRFMDSWHLYSSAATVMSVRVADELKKIIADPTYRGAPIPTTAEIDARLQYASHHPSRPVACESISGKEKTPAGIFKNCTEISFVSIQPRTFVMGSCKKHKKCPPGIKPDPYASRNEYPAHIVKLSHPYQISQTPITVEQFYTFLRYYDGNNMNVHTANLKLDPEFINANKENIHQPITLVSWEDAMEYVAWLNKIKPVTDTGYYRLPTEAEWEYAAHGGNQTVYWWGDDMLPNMANCADCIKKSNKKPLPVGRFPANPYGLYDMNGNVWEWVQDCYRDWYTNKPTDGSAYIRQNCRSRVLRGGGAESNAIGIRTSARLELNKDARFSTTGFRVVREESS